MPRKNKQKKPPLGVVPFELWAESKSYDVTLEEWVERHREVLEATERYQNAGIPIPDPWLAELGIT